MGGYDVSEVHLIDAAGKKKYLVIKDSDGKCVCTGGLCADARVGQIPEPLGAVSGAAPRGEGSQRRLPALHPDRRADFRLGGTDAERAGTGAFGAR